MAQRDPAPPVWHFGRAGSHSATKYASGHRWRCGVGALWSRPYLEELTALGKSPDIHAAARALLDGPRTHHITVSHCLTGHQQQELAALASNDTRLRAALAASGPDGDVIQHLTGGPELLHAYTRGGLFTPVEHALITAALDARRLGHREPIPAALLAAAAEGSLSPRQRARPRRLGGPGHPLPADPVPRKSARGRFRHFVSQEGKYWRVGFYLRLRGAGEVCD